MHLDTSSPESAMRVVIMPNLEDLTKALRAVIFSSVPGSSLFFSVYLLEYVSCQLLFEGSRAVISKRRTDLRTPW
jgi:hypothetical protein